MTEYGWSKKPRETCISCGRKAWKDPANFFATQGRGLDRRYSKRCWRCIRPTPDRIDAARRVAAP